MMRTRARRNPRSKEGVALVLALVFVVLLAAIVTEFTYDIQVDAVAIGQSTTETDAYLAARSAIALSESVLAADLIVGEDQARKNNTGMYDSLDEPWATGTPVVKYNDAMVSVQIADEYGKINLNALLYVDSTGKEVEYTPLVEALRYIFQQRAPDSDPVDAILDWLDSDDVTRPHGFERDYYEKLDPPITCKNGPMDSLEELLLIPGVSQAIYFADSEKDKKTNPPVAPMSEILTVHGHPEGRVNVNTASAEVLNAMFSVASAFGVTATPDQVIQRRQKTGPYTSRKELRSEGILPTPRKQQNPGQAAKPAAQRPSTGPGTGQTAGPAGEDPPQPEFFDVKSSVFRITGDSKLGEVLVHVEAFVWRDTPQEDTPGQNAATGAAQIFRIIGWRLLS